MKIRSFTLCIIMMLFTLPLPVPVEAHSDQFSHPITTGEVYTTTTHCPNCGMNINMWARTRHQFTIDTTQYETCSLRCMTDISAKSGQAPSAIKTAVYFHPQTMGDTKDGWYVVGSQTAGTMTMESKVFFDLKAMAEKFILQHGGHLAKLDAAVAKAQEELGPMRMKLQNKRLKKGKIAIPDGKASCANCGMRPAEYPKFRSQMDVKGVGVLHFCSTKCLIKQKDSLAGKRSSIWVTVYPDGDIDFAEGLYYVVGSDIMGPMGPEALPFREKTAAQEFSKEHGGKVQTYNELKPNLFSGMMHH